MPLQAVPAGFAACIQADSAFGFCNYLMPTRKERCTVKLFDSELKVMEVLWEQGEKPAKDIVDVLAARIGWNKNTTYTVIKKCIEKGAIEREEPGFLCRALVSKEEVAQSETEQLIDKMFGGSSELFFSSFLKNQGISQEEAERLFKMIQEAK